MAQLPIHRYSADNTKQIVAVSEVDDEILPLAQQHSWFMSGEYAATSVNGKTKHLHYFVWEHFEGADSMPDDLQLDHVNQDKLDNRIANLAFVDHRVKQANAPKHRDNTSGYKSVSEDRGKFRAAVSQDNHLIYLGRYATNEEAAYAVNLGYRKLHPEVSTPNEEVEHLLTSEQKQSVSANVERLLRPGRQPYQE